MLLLETINNFLLSHTLAHTHIRQPLQDGARGEKAGHQNDVSGRHYVTVSVTLLTLGGGVTWGYFTAHAQLASPTPVPVLRLRPRLLPLLSFPTVSGARVPVALNASLHNLCPWQQQQKQQQRTFAAQGCEASQFLTTMRCRTAARQNTGVNDFLSYGVQIHFNASAK